MLDGRLPTAQLLAALQYAQPFRGGEHVERQVQRAIVTGFERVENFDDLFPTTRTHVRIIATRSDKPLWLSGGREETVSCARITGRTRRHGQWLPAAEQARLPLDVRIQLRGVRVRAAPAVAPQSVCAASRRHPQALTAAARI